MRGFACLPCIYRDYSTARRCCGACVRLVSVLESLGKTPEVTKVMRLLGTHSIAVGSWGSAATLASSDALVSS